jgi:hypothetical protein
MSSASQRVKQGGHTEQVEAGRHSQNPTNNNSSKINEIWHQYISLFF